MRAYIRENIKNIISISLLLICTTAFICTNELVAKRLPEISTLEVLDVKLVKGQVYDYTGKEIEPDVKRIVFKDEEGTKIKKQRDEITSIQYKNNKKVGSADIEIQLMGYQGSLLIKDVFNIQPGKVEELEITNYTRTNIDLEWKTVAGADGYLVYRSVDNGANFATVMDITDKKVTTYQDIDIQANTNYMYYVCAYTFVKDTPVYGEISDTVSQISPLDSAVLTGVNGVSYNTIQLQWNVVNGAVGYQIYRSTVKDGEYTCIAEIADGAAVSYNDETCEFGTEYFYYIKACQSIENTNVYGDASEVLSARTIPNRVSLAGSVSQDQTQVALAWKETLGAQGYEIYRSANNPNNFQLVHKIEQSDIYSWTDTGLNKDAEYYYCVRAYCVMDGQTVVGNFSNSFYKEVIIVYDYSAFSGDVSVMTQYAGKVPYVWGGKSVKGWDCSGYTYWVFKNHFGVNIGTTVAQQYPKGISISTSDRSAWKPGDLLYYTEGAGPSHVAIYLGNGQLIHSLSPKYGTLIQGVDYYERWDTATSLIAVKRIFQ